MNPLESVLRPLTAMMNRQIQARSPARDLSAELDGRVFAIRVRDTALAAYVIVGKEQVALASSVDGDPDVVICGSLLALARLAGADGEALIRDGSVELSGDALLAQQFRKLMHYGRPDLEEELSHLVGDVAAHGIGNFARGLEGWARNAGKTISQDVSEYLQEERRTVPGRFEVQSFGEKVDSLRDDVARFEARLRIIETNSAPQGGS
jgi:ubiquinone biosynthesis protein UbiJ